MDLKGTLFQTLREILRRCARRSFEGNAPSVMMTWLSAVRLGGGSGSRSARNPGRARPVPAGGWGFQAVSQESWQSVGRTGGVPDGQPGILAERGLNSRAEQTSKLKIWAEVVRGSWRKDVESGLRTCPLPPDRFLPGHLNTRCVRQRTPVSAPSQFHWAGHRVRSPPKSGPRTTSRPGATSPPQTTKAPARYPPKTFLDGARHK